MAKKKVKITDTVPFNRWDFSPIESYTDEEFFEELDQKPYTILIEELAMYAEYCGYVSKSTNPKDKESINKARKRMYKIQDQLRICFATLREDIDRSDYYMSREWNKNNKN